LTARRRGRSTLSGRPHQTFGDRHFEGLLVRALALLIRFGIFVATPTNATQSD
jgi:hypothetical protein